MSSMFERIQGLYALSLELHHYTDAESALCHAVERIAQIMMADRVALILFDRQERQVLQFLKAGPGQDNIDSTVTYDELEEGLSGWVLKTGLPALSPQGQADERESPQVQAHREATNCGDIIVVPMKIGNNLHGTITAINKPQDTRFNASDAELLGLMANYGATLLEHTKILLEARNGRRVAEEARDALADYFARLSAAKDNLADLNRQREHILSAISHDLLGGLGTMRLLFSYIDEYSQVRLPGDVLESAALGHREAQRLISQLEELLAWSRSITGRQVELKEPVDFDGVVLDHAKNSLDEVTRQGIALDLDLHTGALASAQPAALGSIVRNLLSNARKFTPQGGRIRLVGRREGDSLVLEVSDTGAGMEQERVDSFNRGGNMLSTRGQRGERGHGLGLELCRHLARNMDGSLEIASSSPGKGSTFRLTLQVYR